MPHQTRILPALACALLLAGCATPAPAPPPDWTVWQARRNNSIGGSNGWTTLIGLDWLKEGDNRAGSSPTNPAVIRSKRAPAFIGTFTLQGANVSFTPAPGVDITAGDRKVTGKIAMKTDAALKPTRLKIGEVSITAIQRGDRIGLRVKDPNAATRRSFKGLHWFPYDPAWCVTGRFVPFSEKRKLRVADVTGGTQEYDSPGRIVFNVNGSEQHFDVADEGEENELFIIFRDLTAGKSTYHAGRFLYVPKPDTTGRIVMDFNRAFTPPCGFTDYATCPLPPPQNWLTVAVNAGELKPPGH